MLHRAEQPLHALHQLTLGTATEDLGDEGAVFRQHLGGEIQRDLQQMHDPQMIDLRMAAGLGRHVRQHQIGRPAQRLFQKVRGGIVQEVELDQRRMLDRLHRQQVDAHNPATARAARLRPVHGDLGPAARGGAQIHDPLPRFQQPVFLVQLQDLEGRARSVSLALCRHDIGVVQLPLQPAGGRCRPPPGRADPLLDHALAGDRIAAAATAPRPAGTTASRSVTAAAAAIARRHGDGSPVMPCQGAADIRFSGRAARHAAPAGGGWPDGPRSSRRACLRAGPDRRR